MAWTGLTYNAPNADASSIDDRHGLAPSNDQFNTFKALKEAIVTSRKDQYFMPLASVENMPRHFGKTIKVREYIPLLDDRNINDQGIDADGAVITLSAGVRIPVITWDEVDGTAGTAKTNAINGAAVEAAALASNVAETVTLDIAAGGVLTVADPDEAAALAAAIGHGAEVVSVGSGNLYGSSKDFGTIDGKIPLLAEEGGRKNRVGFTRIVREGSIQKLGVFTEFTNDSLQFDSDDQLMRHISTELMNGAVQLSEALLQKDLLSGAGVEYFTGPAFTKGDMLGVSDPDSSSVVTYEDLSRLDQILTDNRTPTQTRVLIGSRFIDTRVVGNARIAYVGSEVVPLLKAMEDTFQRPAFVDVKHYAAAGTVLRGEIGSIGGFRFVQVPEMMHWAGAGAAVGADDYGYRNDGVKFNVYPILVVGDDSFTTIGFQTNGSSVNFNVITKMPGQEQANQNDPYGERGFSSIKWFYGSLIKRPERIAVLYTLAPI